MKKINNCLYGILIFCSLFTSAQENLWTSGRPDGHAPMDVMGDHYHKKGEWMVSYRLMNMTMEGARSGNQDMATSVVHQSYMAAPKEMQMSMHMLGIMYAFSDQLTLMMMTNYSVLSMDLVKMSAGASGFPCRKLHYNCTNTALKPHENCTRTAPKPWKNILCFAGTRDIEGLSV